MMKKAVSLLLVLTLALGLTVPAMAYSTPDFSDLPSDNWAYGPVMRMADQGYIQGTGNNQFSPTMKVSAAQFLTLVGRIVFPETTVGANDTWYGPYVAAAQANGLLTGTQVNPAAPEAEITRYDMAVVLRAAAKKLGKAETLAQQSQVTDYGMVPTMYGDAVLAVYGMGLITGDQNGNFNGSNTMMRNELATVIDRLVALKAPGGSSTEPEAPVESEKPVEPQTPDMVHISLEVHASHPVPYSQAVGLGYDLIFDSAPFKLLYTEDGGKTSRMIGEGYSQSYIPGSSWDSQTIEFDVDRNVVKAGTGEFYLSGEMDYEGVHYATHDLRTDGRATVIPLDMDRVLQGYVSQRVEMVPAATGYQRIVTLDQYYGSTNGRRLEAQCRYFSAPENVPYVKLWTQTPLSGTLLASALIESNGRYHMEFGVDILDYQPDRACYKVYIVDADDGTIFETGSLYTLKQLKSEGNSKIE